MDENLKIELNELYEPKSKAKIGDKVIQFALTLIVSSCLYYLGLTRILFVVPLMIYSLDKNKSLEALIFAVEFLLISLIESYLVYSNIEIFDNLKLPLIIIKSIIPLTYIVSGIIWIKTNKVKKVENRVLFALLPILLLSLGVFIWLNIDRALFIKLFSYYKNVFVNSYGNIIELFGVAQINEEFFFLISISFLSLVLPLYLLAVCVSAHFYESVRHSRESSWEDRVSNFELNTNNIWLFLACWGIILLSYFISMPIALSIVMFNLAFAFTLVYTFEGFTVFFYRLRRRATNLKSLTLLVMMFVITLIVPGINIILLLAFTIMGLLENFFDLKKKGEKNENYS